MAAYNPYAEAAGENPYADPEPASSSDPYSSTSSVSASTSLPHPPVYATQHPQPSAGAGMNSPYATGNSATSQQPAYHDAYQTGPSPSAPPPPPSLTKAQSSGGGGGIFGVIGGTVKNVVSKLKPGDREESDPHPQPQPSRNTSAGGAGSGRSTRYASTTASTSGAAASASRVRQSSSTPSGLADSPSLCTVFCNPCEEESKDLIVTEEARNNVCRALCDEETSKSCAMSSADGPVLCLRGVANLLMIPLSFAMILVAVILNAVIVILAYGLVVPTCGFRVLCASPYMTPCLKFFCVLGCPFLWVAYILRTLGHAFAYALGSICGTLFCDHSMYSTTRPHILSDGLHPNEPLGCRALCCVHAVISGFWSCRVFRSIKHGLTVLQDRLVEHSVQRDRRLECCGLKLVTASLAALLSSVVALVVCGLPCGLRMGCTVCTHFCSEDSRMETGCTCAPEAPSSSLSSASVGGLFSSVFGRRGGSGSRNSRDARDPNSARARRASVPEECCCCEACYMCAWYCLVTPLHSIATFFMHAICTVCTVFPGCFCNTYEDSLRFDILAISGLVNALQRCWTGQKSLQSCYDEEAAQAIHAQHKGCVIERECDDMDTFMALGDRAKSCCSLDNTPGKILADGKKRAGLLGSNRRDGTPGSQSMS
eukprot:ANDGO_03710.mRNA.1 hypothetical protein